MLSNLPFFVSVVYIIHHFYVHKNDTDKTFFEKFFQLSDVQNHESRVVFFFALGLGMKIQEHIIPYLKKKNYL